MPVSDNRNSFLRGNAAKPAGYSNRHTNAVLPESAGRFVYGREPLSPCMGRCGYLIVADWRRYICGFWAAAEDDAAMRRPLLALGWIGALDVRCRT